MPEWVKDEMARRSALAEQGYEYVRHVCGEQLLTKEEYCEFYMRLNFPPLVWTSSSSVI